MGFFNKIFKLDKNTEIVSQVNEEKSLAYDSELINTLRNEQKVLFKEWENIVDVALGTDEYTFKLKDAIDNFVTKLDAHIHIENDKLYAYLEDKYTSETNEIIVIKRVRKKMNSMVKEIGYFSKKYGDRENCNRCFEQLVAELDIKTNEFIKCMGKKEELYEMYK